MLENLGEEFHAHGDGNDGAENIGDGLGVEDTGGAEELGQQENGGKIHGLSPEAQGQGHLNLTHARQAVDDGVLDIILSTLANGYSLLRKKQSRD